LLNVNHYDILEISSLLLQTEILIKESNLYPSEILKNLLDKTLNKIRSKGYREQEIKIEILFAKYELKQKEKGITNSTTHLRQALILAKSMNNHWLMSEIYLYLSQIAVINDEYKIAYDWCERALQIHSNKELSELLWQIYFQRGKLAFIHNEWDEARRYYEKSLHIMEKLASSIGSKKIEEKYYQQKEQKQIYKELKTLEIQKPIMDKSIDKIEFQRSKRKFDILLQISQRLILTLESEELLEVIINMVIEIISVEQAFLFLVNEKQELIYEIGRSRLSGNISEKEAKYSSSIIKRCMNILNGIYQLDASKHNYWGKQDSIRELKIKTVICLPLKITIQSSKKRTSDKLETYEKIIGILYLDSSTIVEDFNLDKLELLEIFAGYAAISLEKVKLYEEQQTLNRKLGKKVWDLRSLFDMSRQLNASLDVDNIAHDLLLTSIGNVGSQAGAIMLLKEDSDILTIKDSSGLEGSEKGITFNMQENFISLLRIGEPLLLDQPNILEKLSQSEKERIEILQAKLAIPIIKDTHLRGIMLLGFKAQNINYEKDEIDILETFTNQAAVALETARLYQMATVDSLTKVYIRRHFGQRLNDEFKMAKRYHTELSLIMVDVDHFKRFNDNYGHQLGDLVLQEVGVVLKKTSRETDIPARYGGEEFAIILPSTDTEGAYILAERLRNDIEMLLIPSPKGNLKVTVSVGVATYPQIAHIDSPRDLIEEADKALYRSKETGRNKVTVA